MSELQDLLSISLKQEPKNTKEPEPKNDNIKTKIVNLNTKVNSVMEKSLTFVNPVLGLAYKYAVKTKTLRKKIRKLKFILILGSACALMLVITVHKFTTMDYITLKLSEVKLKAYMKSNVTVATVDFKDRDAITIKTPLISETTYNVGNFDLTGDFAPVGARITLNEQQLAFFKYFVPIVIKGQVDSSVLVSITLAQKITESGWGITATPHDLYTGVDSHNLFGIKYYSAGANGSGSYVTAWSEEEVNGVRYNELSKWRAYDSVEASVADHAQVLKNMFIQQNMADAATFDDQNLAIKKAGYATAGNYLTVMRSYYDTFNLGQYDVMLKNLKEHQSTASTQLTPSDATQASVVAFAKTLLGIKYVWGGTTTAGFDCSGFTQYVYAHFGITIPRVSQAQALTGTLVSRENAKPGDLIFYSASTPNQSGHVAMYIGNDQIIEAPQTGDVVKIIPYYTGGLEPNITIRRIADLK